MSYTGRTNSRNSLKEGRNKNASNSKAVQSRRPNSGDTLKQTKDMNNQKKSTSSTMKVLGQDTEVTVEELWDLNQQGPDRYTPISSRSKPGSRTGSSSTRRTPTPSKQISLQAVKRKEEKDEPLEKIDWNDFDRPISITEERLPSCVQENNSDSSNSPRDSAVSAAKHLALIELREQELSSALSSLHFTKDEEEIDLKLNLIEGEREERQQREKEEEEQRLLRQMENERVSENIGGVSYRNEHFRNLSERDKKNKIDSNFIMGNHQQTDAPMSDVRVLQGPVAWFRDPTIQSIDNTLETQVEKERAQPKPEVQKVKRVRSADSESKKKNEASGNAEESSGDDNDDDEEEEEDLFGHKGKAPNHLLMEFLSCVMEEDYENAEKLCKMILIYEPSNPEALSFFPLIQEKRQQEEEEEDDEEDDSDDNEESGDDDDDDDDDDEDDNDEEGDDDEDDDSEAEDDDDDDSELTEENLASKVMYALNQAQGQNDDPWEK